MKKSLSLGLVAALLLIASAALADTVINLDIGGHYNFPGVFGRGAFVVNCGPQAPVVEAPVCYIKTSGAYTVGSDEKYSIYQTSSGAWDSELRSRLKCDDAKQVLQAKIQSGECSAGPGSFDCRD